MAMDCNEEKFMPCKLSQIIYLTNFEKTNRTLVSP